MRRCGDAAVQGGGGTGVRDGAAARRAGIDRAGARRAEAEAAQVIAAAAAAIGTLAGEAPRIRRWATVMAACLRQGGTVLTAGNGGSATHAAHLASELVGRFRQDREPLRAMCLTAEGSVLSALGNDYGFDQVFARQIAALAGQRDVVVLFSTSGRSPNVVAAARAARHAGAQVFALTGPGDSPVAAVSSDTLHAAGCDTAAIQDAHHVAVHALCAALEAILPTVTRPEVVPWTS